MENTKELKLVKGIFDVEDATDILCHLLNKKINYHSCKILSSYERFGVESEYSKQRVEELRQTKKELLAIIKEAKLSGKNLEVNSEILISLTSEEVTANDKRPALSLA